MIQKLSISSLFFLFAQFAIAQTPFPELTGETLTDKTVTIPKDTKGKKTLLGVAYSKKAEENLRGWFQPAYSRFINPPKTNFFPVEPFEGNIYFIPMLKGLAASAANKVEKELKKGVDQELHEYILIYAGSIKAYKEDLGLEAKDDPYFFVLDEEGNIVHTTSGSYSDEKMEEIEEILDF